MTARGAGWLLVTGAVGAVPLMWIWYFNAGPRHREISAFQNEVLGPILFGMFWLGIMLLARGVGRAVALVVMVCWGIVWFAISNPDNKGLVALAIGVMFLALFAIQAGLGLVPAAVQGAVAGAAIRASVSDPPGPTIRSSTVAERLAQLAELRDKGVVTEDEFARKHKEILDSL